MMVRIIFVFTVLFYSCKVNKLEKAKNEVVIEITGYSENAKLSAVLVCNDTLVYYINEYEQWPDSLYRKKLKIKGSYRFETELREEINGFVKPSIPEKHVITEIKKIEIIQKE